LIDWLVGWLVGWLDVWLVAGLVVFGCFVGWLVIIYRKVILAPIGY
jgi:hypothetical protein